MFVSGAANELRFFADNTTVLPIQINQTVVNVPAALSMNTLTLNGRGPNSTAGFPITVGDSSSTWTIGDGTTSTVNLNSTLGGGGADRDVRCTIGANLTLVGNTSGITTFTGGTRLRAYGAEACAAPGNVFSISPHSVILPLIPRLFTGPGRWA